MPGISSFLNITCDWFVCPIHDSSTASSSSMHNHLENTQKPAPDSRQVFNHNLLLCAFLFPALLFALGSYIDFFLLDVIAACIVFQNWKIIYIEQRA